MLKSLLEGWHTFEEFEQIYFHDRAGWKVRGLLLEATMHVYLGVNCPDCVPEALQAVKLVPLATFSFIDFKLNVLAYSISATTDDNHHRSNKDARVLIPCKWFRLSVLVWCLDPVPRAISMTPQTPRVFEC